MARIPLTLQTLYADLVQQAHTGAAEAGTVYTQSIKGIEYLYLRTSVGASRRDRFLGRADDPSVVERAQQARAAAQLASERRKIVRILSGQGLPSPTTEMGRVLDALADAGLFSNAVLVGTGAYQCYSAIVGEQLPAGAPMRQGC